MEHRFDQLAKALAQGVSRREALRRLGSTLVGTVFASLGIRSAWGQSSDLRAFCRAYCREKFPPARRQSCEQACEACGGDVGRLCPSTFSDSVACCAAETPGCCNGICTNTVTDPHNCGRCGATCPADAPVCCDGRCVNPQTDRANCGTCGSTCFLGACCNGRCCPNEFEECCDGACTSVLNNPRHCGACNNRCASGVCCETRCCASGQVCCGGVCCDPRACRNGVCTSSSTCRSDSDCRVFSDYCEGCNCRALLVSEPDPGCNGTLVNCIRDPCEGLRPVCDRSTGKCVAR